MTNLSKELCEICGIEPIKLYGCEFKNLSEYGISWGVDVCPAAEDESIRCEHCEHSKVADFLYPDFENAENFKKLFNLKYGKASWETVIFRFLKCGFQVINTTEFLEKFLNMLKYHNCYATEQLIKAIRQADWEV